MKKITVLMIENRRFQLTDEAMSLFENYQDQSKNYFGRRYSEADFEKMMLEKLDNYTPQPEIFNETDLMTIITECEKIKDTQFVKSSFFKRKAQVKEINPLMRNLDNKVLGGVCSGLSENLNIDVSLLRVIFVLLALFSGGGVLIYFILWIVIPAKESYARFQNRAEYQTL